MLINPILSMTECKDPVMLSYRRPTTDNPGKYQDAAFEEMTDLGYILTFSNTVSKRGTPQMRLVELTKIQRVQNIR